MPMESENTINFKTAIPQIDSGINAHEQQGSKVNAFAELMSAMLNNVQGDLSDKGTTLILQQDSESGLASNEQKNSPESSEAAGANHGVLAAANIHLVNTEINLQKMTGSLLAGDRGGRISDEDAMGNGNVISVKLAPAETTTQFITDIKDIGLEAGIKRNEAQDAGLQGINLLKAISGQTTQSEIISHSAGKDSIKASSEQTISANIRQSSMIDSKTVSEVLSSVKPALETITSQISVASNDKDNRILMQSQAASDKPNHIAHNKAVSMLNIPADDTLMAEGVMQVNKNTFSDDLFQKVERLLNNLPNRSEFGSLDGEIISHSAGKDSIKASSEQTISANIRQSSMIDSKTVSEVLSSVKPALETITSQISVASNDKDNRILMQSQAASDKPNHIAHNKAVSMLNIPADDTLMAEGVMQVNKNTFSDDLFQKVERLLNNLPNRSEFSSVDGEIISHSTGKDSIKASSEQTILSNAGQQATIAPNSMDDAATAIRPVLATKTMENHGETASDNRSSLTQTAYSLSSDDLFIQDEKPVYHKPSLEDSIVKNLIDEASSKYLDKAHMSANLYLSERPVSNFLTSADRVIDLPKNINVGDLRFSLVQTGDASIELTLQPDGIGKLEIEMVSAKGVINAYIGASDPIGKELIENNLQGIMDALAKEGINIGGFSVFLRDKKGGMNSESGEKKIVFNKEDKEVKAVSLTNNTGRSSKVNIVV